jgi:hypothetical protein
MQQEKIKRDKWAQDKTRQIKEQTIKGLEPEIQNLISQHKAQLRDSEERFRQQILKEKSILNEQFQQQLVPIISKHSKHKQISPFLRDKRRAKKNAILLELDIKNSSKEMKWNFSNKKEN